MHDQLGPAVNSGKALFLYGAPGNGKTVIAEGIGRALGGDMYVPHAHRRRRPDHHDVRPGQPRRRSSDAGRSQSVVATAPHDRRWVRIRRPVVVVGGELTLEMLDLTFNPIAKFYEAPIQLKANGGVFVVDDFGRQRIPPARPAEPLDRAAREPRRLPHAAHRPEVRDAVRRASSSSRRTSSRSRSPTKRSCAASRTRSARRIRRSTSTRRIFEMNCRKRGAARSIR